MILHLNQNRSFLFVKPKLPPPPLQPQTRLRFSLKARTFRVFKSTHIATLNNFSPVESKRVPRHVKIEAQRVLTDYLHSTRGYSFLDAEYISKNCPNFVKSLIANTFVGGNDVDVDVDGVAHSLRKFLRNRIGEIYKEAKEVFGYPKGFLLEKFREYEELGLSKSFIIKLGVCCPSILVCDHHGEFVVVLDWLKRIGIEDDWIVSYMSYSRTYSWKKMLDAIQLLDEVGYSEEQMHNLFKANPKLLLEGFGKKLRLFLVRSHKLGVKVNVMYSYFMEYPHILLNKCAKNLLRVIDILCAIGMETDEIARILSNYMHLFSTHSFKGPRTVISELKVEKAELLQVIKDDPLKLISMASSSKKKSPKQISVYDPRRHLDKITFLLKLGYAENSEEMANALKVFRGRGDLLQERFDCLVEAGLDYNSVIGMIKRAPTILNQKKDVIKEKIHFATNILGYPLESIVAFPTYFCYDLEKIAQRFSMYAWLKERKVVNPSLTLSTIVSSNDKRFEKYFVDVHPQGPTIWKNIKRLSKKNKNK
ncbi:transcription termination factor MTEF18, mitochondrial [Arachis hypogaea]|uniref:transcription termination factor MTEF18, mitochondrial n=1 Tax=Arachis hypogaea TaxID=3818 RepID=UPI000DEC4155|nr:transcription termination factor MTEF18, mitochondrial [Arachis hypogaea]